MNTEVASVSYRVEFTVDEFNAIMALDKQNSEESKNTLLQEMKIFPIGRIEYNGHFGPNVFYTINGEDNSMGMRELIHKRIQSYVRKGLKLSKRSV